MAALNSASAYAQALVLLQPRMEAWLGRIGAYADALALPTDAASSSSEDGMSQWDPAKMLTIAMRYSDPDIAVWLGRLLPDVRNLPSHECCGQVAQTLTHHLQGAKARMELQQLEIPCS